MKKFLKALELPEVKGDEVAAGRVFKKLQLEQENKNNEGNGVEEGSGKVTQQTNEATQLVQSKQSTTI